MKIFRKIKKSIKEFLIIDEPRISYQDFYDAHLDIEDHIEELIQDEQEKLTEIK